MILDILSCEHELTVVGAVTPLNKTLEKGRIYRDMSTSRSLAAQLGLPSGGGDQLAEAYAVLDGTHPSGEQAEYFRWQLTVLAYAHDPKALEAVIDHVRQCCTRHGASLVREGLVAEGAFWHVLPGRKSYSRPWELLTWPIAAYWLPQSAGEGIAAHDWAPHPITTFRSIQGGGFRFTWHPHGREMQDPLGHCVVIAPPGTGEDDAALPPRGADAADPVGAGSGSSTASRARSSSPPPPAAPTSRTSARTARGARWR